MDVDYRIARDGSRLTKTAAKHVVTDRAVLDVHLRVTSGLLRICSLVAAAVDVVQAVVGATTAPLHVDGDVAVDVSAHIITTEDTVYCTTSDFKCNVASQVSSLCATIHITNAFSCTACTANSDLARLSSSKITTAINFGNMHLACIIIFLHGNRSAASDVAFGVGSAKHALDSTTVDSNRSVA